MNGNDLVEMTADELRAYDAKCARMAIDPEFQSLCATMRSALGPTQRAVFDAMPMEQQDWIIANAIKDGMIEFGAPSKKFAAGSFSAMTYGLRIVPKRVEGKGKFADPTAVLSWRHLPVKEREALWMTCAANWLELEAVTVLTTRQSVQHYMANETFTVLSLLLSMAKELGCNFLKFDRLGDQYDLPYYGDD